MTTIPSSTQSEFSAGRKIIGQAVARQAGLASARPLLARDLCWYRWHLGLAILR